MKECAIQFRVTIKERKKIKRRAKQKKMTVSQYIRELLNEELNSKEELKK